MYGKLRGKEGNSYPIKWPSKKEKQILATKKAPGLVNWLREEKKLENELLG